jgi:hypothetical protein
MFVSIAGRLFPVFSASHLFNWSHCATANLLAVLHVSTRLLKLGWSNIATIRANWACMTSSRALEEAPRQAGRIRVRSRVPAAVLGLTLILLDAIVSTVFFVRMLGGAHRL